jgi:hypothetical protein
MASEESVRTTGFMLGFTLCQRVMPMIALLSYPEEFGLTGSSRLGVIGECFEGA